MNYTNEFDKVVAKYEAQGYSYSDAYTRAKRYLYNHKRYEEQKAIRGAIKRLEIDDPAEYRKLMWQVEHAEEAAAERREDARRLREEQERLEGLRLFKYEHSLVVAGVPNIDFSGVEGMVAFRTWNVRRAGVDLDIALRYGREGGLFLGSMVMSAVWKSVMIADRVPAEDNNSGLYCVKLDPLGLMTRASYYLGEVCGLLELRGRVLEHTDGVMKAEWARIICVFLQASERTEGIYGGLSQSYPTVPIYVLHKEQIAEVLLRVTMMQSMRENYSE